MLVCLLSIGLGYLITVFFFRRFGIQRYRSGGGYSLCFSRSSIYYLLDSSMPWRVKVYVKLSLPTGSNYLIMFVGISQHHCANHTWHTSWQPFCQYDIQSLFGADSIRWYIICTRSQVGTLCESSTTCYVYWCVKYIFAPNNGCWLCGVVQMVATILAAFIQVRVKQWIFEHVPDICNPNQISQLTCPHNQVFYTASAVWWVLVLNIQISAFINHHS